MIEVYALSRRNIRMTQLPESHNFLNTVVIKHSLHILIAFHLLQCHHLGLLILFQILLTILSALTSSLDISSSSLSILLPLRLKHLPLLFREPRLLERLVHLGVGARPNLVGGIEIEFLRDGVDIVEKSDARLENADVCALHQGRYLLVVELLQHLLSL